MNDFDLAAPCRYKSYCKLCSGKNTQEYNNFLKETFHLRKPPENKICPKCKINKKSTEFNISKTRKDCLSVYCKGCRAEKRQEPNFHKNDILSNGKNARNLTKEEKLEYLKKLGFNL